MYRRLRSRGSRGRSRSRCAAPARVLGALVFVGLVGCPRAEPPEAPEHQRLIREGTEQADLCSLSFLEALLEQQGEMRSIPRPLLPWGGPTLSGLWPPGDPRATGLVPDLDSTAWHFKLNRMPIPSSVTNRFLSEAPLPSPFANACRAPACTPERIPRFYAGDDAVDLLGAINFVTGVDEHDALNAQVKSAVDALAQAVESNAVEWSVHPPAARESLLRVYRNEPTEGTVPEFVYRRRLPNGEPIEVNNRRIAALLSDAS